MKGFRYGVVFSGIVLCLTGSVPGHSMSPSLEPWSRAYAAAPLTDRVAVVSFTVSPEKPLQGEKVQVKMTIKNVGSVPVGRVPWKIDRDGSTVDSGSYGRLDPGVTFDIPVFTWFASGLGSHSFTGFADPDNVLSEDQDGSRYNNVANKTVNVIQGIAPISPQILYSFSVTSLTTDNQFPLVGRPLKVYMKVKNPGPNTVTSLPWKISNRGSVVGSGNMSISPGREREVSASFTPAAAGNLQIIGEADSDNALSEPASQRSDNKKELNVQAAQPATAWVGYLKAKGAGAEFNNNVVSGVCPQLGVGSETQLHGDDVDVLFRASCFGSPTGGHAQPEAFRNFKLKNGWKVKQAIGEVIQKELRAGWTWMIQPAAGSDDPFTKVDISANPNATIVVHLHIIIEGPENTNPYR